MHGDNVIRRARVAAGLTQEELARRMGVSQPVVARLERADANPRLTTLERVLRATGHRLELRALAEDPVDVTQIDRQLALTPAERLRSHAAALRNVGGLRTVARRVRG